MKEKGCQEIELNCWMIYDLLMIHVSLWLSQ